LLTVGNSAAVVEELLGNGLLPCPGCGGRLGGWGHAARRPVFTAGRVPVAVRPRRARCGSCGVTHVLLPAWLLDLPRTFRTAYLRLIYAVDCRSTYSSWACRGLRY